MTNLDPEVEAFREKQRQLNIPPYQDVEVGMARLSSRAVTSWRQTLGRGTELIGSLEDLELPGAVGPLAARVYSPPTHPIGVVTYFHGGGFVVGDLDTCDAHCRAICARSGVIVVSVDYRLAPEAPFPAAVDDAYAAVGWVAANITGRGARVLPHAVAGDSAGGNLALAAAIKARDAGWPLLDAQLLIYPMLDPWMQEASIQKFGYGHMLDEATLEWFWSLYFSGDEHRTGRTSVLGNLMAANLSGLPTTIIVCGELDPLHDEAMRFAGLLRSAGVQSEFRSYSGLVHGFFGWGAFIGSAETAISDACGGLRETLLTAREAR